MGFANRPYQLIGNHPRKNDETGNVRKLSKVNFLIPWGTKLHIGIEDVVVLVNNVSRNSIQDNASEQKSDSFLRVLNNRSTMVDKLCLMLQTSCVPRFSKKYISEPVILQSFSLFETKNDKITKLGNGETITIDNPLMNTNIVTNFNCMPNVIVLELLLVSTKEYITKEMYPSDVFSTTSTKSNSTTNNTNKPEMWRKQNIGIKFRFNYIIY